MGTDSHIYKESMLCKLVRDVCQKCVGLANEKSNKELENAEEFSSGIFNSVFNSYEKTSNYIGYPHTKDNNYKTAIQLLENSWLPDQAQKELRAHLSLVDESRNDLFASVNSMEPFPGQKRIADYLEAYYGLLKLIYWHHKHICDSDLVEEKFVELILNVDMVFEEETAYATLYAPTVLDGIGRLYDVVFDYYRIVQTVHEKEVQSNYTELVISKLLRFFRWMVVHDGSLMQAAVPAYWAITESRAEQVIQGHQKWSLDIPIRNLHDYSSYEGIGELRLLDKILYEIDNRMDILKMSCNGQLSKNNSSIAVTIIGDINARPMKLLCDILVKNLQTDDNYKQCKDLKIKFNVYTCNKDWVTGYQINLSNKVFCNFHSYTNQLRYKSETDDLIEKTDIMFILDSCDLYKSIKFKKMQDTDLFWQHIAVDTYEANRRSAGELDMVRTGNFANLIQQLTVLNNQGELGWLKKEVNTTLLRFMDVCRTRYSKSVRKKKSIYIYVSDIEAFHSMYRDEQQFVRIERYNEKEIAIMRLSDYDEDELAPGKTEGPRIIVFTIWQLIKHIAVRNIQYMAEYFNLEIMESYLLREVLIGVDYTDWPRKLKFRYYIPDLTKQKESYDMKKMEGLVRSYIEKVIMPVFRDGTRDMYNQYFIKSFASFLYSDAKDVHDMLFLHLFLNKHELLRAVCLSDESEPLENYRPKQCKYSQKRFYGDVMKDYDTSSESFAFKYTKLEQIEKEGRLPKKNIFSNIITSCEENHYEDSYLYLNCSKML